MPEWLGWVASSGPEESVTVVVNVRAVLVTKWMTRVWGLLPGKAEVAAGD